MPYRPLRRTAIATAVALASSLASAGAATAAGTGSTAPVITISSPVSLIDEYGPAGDLDITVTGQTETDAYIRLALSGGNNQGQWTFTDDTGTVQPVTEAPNQPVTVTVAAADSDHNGIPGAPLHDEVIHLHVSVGYPAPPPLVTVTGYLVDGASGTVFARTGIGAGGEIGIGEPLLSSDWYVPGEGDPVSGSEVGIPTGGPVVTTAVMTQMAMHTPPAVTRTRWTIPGDQISGAGYTPAQLAAALHVSYSPNTGVYATQHWTITDDGSLVMDLPTRQWVGSGMATEDLHITVDWGLPAGTLTGVFQTIAADGTPYAQSHRSLRFTTDTVPASRRAAIYGRDSAGVLWQYQANPQAAHPGTLQPRARVGGGWNTYTAVTALGTLNADNTGDLVARDTTGVLWLYRGTGNPAAPFQPRTRIGGGWNTYTQIVGVGDMTGDGRADLLAVDHDGQLWLYGGTGNAASPYAPRVQVGTGWNTYSSIVGVGDMTGDGHPDLLARDTTGHLWYYRGTGNPAAPYAPRVQNGYGWNTYNALI